MLEKGMLRKVSGHKGMRKESVWTYRDLTENFWTQEDIKERFCSLHLKGRNRKLVKWRNGEPIIRDYQVIKIFKPRLFKWGRQVEWLGETINIDGYRP
jgi:hypothetical protein